MAKIEALSGIKFPLTEKPTILYTPENFKQYADTFNLQNTCRLIIQNFTEEAPTDSKTYGRKDSGWIEMSGGGGGIPEAPEDSKTYGRYNATWKEVTGGGGGGTPVNLFLTGSLVSSDSNYRDYTVFSRLPAAALISSAPKWEFSMWVQANAPFSIGPIRLLKTAIGSDVVLEYFDIKLNGLNVSEVTPPSTAIFRVVVDPIIVEMKGDFDYHLAVYFPASNAVNNNVGVMTSNSYVVGSYVAGNRTADATVPLSGTSTYLISNIRAVP